MRNITLLSCSALTLIFTALAGCGSSDAAPGNPAADAGTDSAVPDSGDTTTDGGADGGVEKTGFETVVKWPDTGELKHLSMALDDAGDPMLAYMTMTSTGDAVWFTRWSSKTGAWAAPVKVDDVETVEENDPHRETSVAFDATTKEIGIAYSADRNPSSSSTSEVRFALSKDGGQTFAKETVSVAQDPPAFSEDAQDASLVMAGGVAYVVYAQAWQLCKSGRCTGGFFAERAAAGGWTRTALPIPAGADDIRMAPTAIALDSAGNPGIAYWARGPGGNGQETRLVYAKPKASFAKDEVFTALVQNDVISVSLDFDGTKALLATHLQTEDAATYDLKLAEGDIGAWTKSDLPRALADTTARYQSVSFGSGELVVGAEFATASGKSSSPCGPKLLRRKPSASTFEVTCPDATVLEGFAGRYVGVAHRPNGKLVVSFVLDATDKPNVARGIVVWRE